MYVVKRNGRQETVAFDKITSRLRRLVWGLDVDPTLIAQKVIQGIYSGVTTVELDELASNISASMATHHPDFSKLAARIAISNLHKQTKKAFSDVVDQLYHYRHPKNNEAAPLISEEIHRVVMENRERLDSSIIYDRDYDLDFFGFKTLEKSYLLRVDNRVAERPQHMLMRVSAGIHGDDIDAIIETYQYMSQRFFIHATPTLFNSGTPRPQMSSCFLMTVKDSIEGIYDALKNCACISKSAGGIGISVHDIRSRGSYIRGSNGVSNGLVPMLRVFNDTARYVDQGGGRRKGSFAIYLEPSHPDIFEFLELRKNHGNELERARDLFYALWVPDLFMKRVETNAQWSLFCPNEAPGLSEVYGEEYERLYAEYEAKGIARRTLPAQELWFAILESQVETGTPYMLFKDACNSKSNQKNVGVIKSSNLCTEIVEYTSEDEIAVCNLASISLPNYVIVDEKRFDFDKLHEVTKVVTRNLNKVIDRNHYPVEPARKSNLRHRPIGIGVQGLADAFVLMRFPFDSPEAARLNKDIFETIYHGAVEASMELAQKDGPYETFPGSPMSQGLFQFDLWGVQPDSGMWDWETLRTKVKDVGVRNSLLLAPMPTASTAQILGNTESIEVPTSNMYMRRVLSGEFIVTNRYLMKDLIDMKLWTPELRQELIRNEGSVQGLDIPPEIKALYKTVWEVKQKTIIDMAAARGPYICQSQSLNIHLANPSTSQLTSMHFYAWRKGLKTGMYYLRSQPKRQAVQFTVDGGSGASSGGSSRTKETSSTDQKEEEETVLVCRRGDDEGCVACSA